MSSEGILSFSPTSKNECELCGKSFIHRQDLLRYQRTTHGEKTFKCHLCPNKTGRKDNLTSHQRVRTSNLVLNRKRKASETHLSPKRINLPKETQQHTNLKRKITHQEPVTPSIHPRIDHHQSHAVNESVFFFHPTMP